MSFQEFCSFTGHRPSRLPWGYREEDPRCVALKQRMTQAICLAYDHGKRHFISGMAQGTDLYFAEIVLDLRKQYEGILLECARPCETQAGGWSQKEKLRYEEILSQCNFETMVQHQYSPGCMMRRNRYMVEHSSTIIAVYDGNPRGGTAKTIQYALKCGLNVQILELS